MNNNFILLECDDVVLLGEDTLKASRIQQLVEENIQEKLQRHIYEYNSFHPGASMLEFFGNIPIGKTKIRLTEIKQQYITDCQVLRSSGQGWENGKLKIEIRVFPGNNYENQIYLGFIPEEPIEYEALLDEICHIASDNAIGEWK
ncbi:KGK domain-containing protein [Rivularia sp. UHCC 0363]|uniref:KGK domain-containing protein n=1 Tax=Rivularia sp. UHCC 0363 TaxID=3110244 RepID=UPI002B20EC96|nr:KGK domain-containing protein [Rivularia sp. UHCC 0363]MEA5595547.1 KGK domain-containing protein [Rivularia sp. UHCC 0363]